MIQKFSNFRLDQFLEITQNQLIIVSKYVFDNI